jgi:hypothetical protein
MGPRAGLDTVAMKENACPYRELNPGHPDRSLITMLSELCPKKPTGKVAPVGLFNYHAMKTC